MQPWDIIGWTIIGVPTFGAAVFVLVILWGMASLHWKHLGTRNTPVAAGQVWVQDDVELDIAEVCDTHIVVKYRTSPWQESHEDWKMRVRTRKLYLKSS